MASADKAAEGSSLVFHPMDQFIVQPIFGEGAIQWYTITNMTLWMALAVICVIGLMVVGTSRRAVIPNRSQSIAELAYVFVYKTAWSISPIS
jgi:F-type H+-transporting ATPase subunit a